MRQYRWQRHRPRCALRPSSPNKAAESTTSRLHGQRSRSDRMIVRAASPVRFRPEREVSQDGRQEEGRSGARLPTRSGVCLRGASEPTRRRPARLAGSGRCFLDTRHGQRRVTVPVDRGKPKSALRRPRPPEGPRDSIHQPGARSEASPAAKTPAARRAGSGHPHRRELGRSPAAVRSAVGQEPATSRARTSNGSATVGPFRADNRPPARRERSVRYREREFGTA
ncbi:hypothetical protein DFJ74DRAFT_4316 [Hyaloraphidium curvatum]|nr:hypothetical protein DFJ74DRAFT_4316 [Hyaloraphidium curvatum]